MHDCSPGWGVVDTLRHFVFALMVCVDCQYTVVWKCTLWYAEMTTIATLVVLFCILRQWAVIFTSLPWYSRMSKFTISTRSLGTRCVVSEHGVRNGEQLERKEVWWESLR